MGVEGAEATSRGQGRAPPTGPCGAADRGRPGPWVAPQAALWSVTSSCRINIPRKFSSNSENISRSRFFEIKNSKNRELALGILSIG